MYGILAMTERSDKAEWDGTKLYPSKKPGRRGQLESQPEEGWRPGVEK